MADYADNFKVNNYKLRCRVKFFVDIIGVALDGSRRDNEFFGNLLICQSAGQQMDDIQFSVG